MIKHINLQTEHLSIHKMAMSDYDAYRDMLEISKFRFFFRINDNQTIGIYVGEELIGHLRLLFLDRNSLNVGYRLREKYRGQGYMKEAVIAVSEYLENYIETLVIMTDHDNYASQGVAEACGYELVDTRGYYKYVRSKNED